MYRKLYFIGALVYMYLLVISLLFFKERTIITDTAATLFNILKDNSYSLQLSRICAVFTESFPLLGAVAGLSLAKVMMSYSAGFIVFYSLCFFTCGTILKKYDFALLILLLNILFVSDSFYWIISELPQGIAFLVVVLAFINSKHFTSITAGSISTLIIATAILSFFHPLIVFPILFSAGYFLLEKRERFIQKALYITVFTFFGIAIIKTIAAGTRYDHHSMSGIKNFITLFPDYFTTWSTKQFLHHCLTRYFWIPVVLTGIIALYTTTRHWKKLGLFITFFTGYLLLVNVSYPTTATPAFYIENLYLPLALFLAIPFVFDVLPFLSTYRLAIPVFIIIILTSCIRIYQAHNFYTARLNWERAFLKEHAGTKIIYPAAKTPMDILLMNWGTPYEFWLLSTIEQNKTASIIIDDKPELRSWAAYKTKSLLVNWNVIPYDQLNPKYFHFTDTTTGYQIIK